LVFQIYTQIYTEFPPINSEVSMKQNILRSNACTRLEELGNRKLDASTHNLFHEQQPSHRVTYHFLRRQLHFCKEEIEKLEENFCKLP